MNGLNGDSVTNPAFRDFHVLIPRRSRHAIVISSNLRRYVIGRRVMDAVEAQGWTGHCLQSVCRQLSSQHVLILLTLKDCRQRGSGGQEKGYF